MSERVLLVDPCDDARWALARTLECGGLEVLEATDAEHARVIVSATRPAAVLLDLQLPDPAGLARALRADGRRCGVGLLTTLSREWVVDRVDLAAFDALVDKPTRAESLVGTVRFLARLGARPTARARPSHALRV